MSLRPRVVPVVAPEAPGGRLAALLRLGQQASEAMQTSTTIPPGALLPTRGPGEREPGPPLDDGRPRPPVRVNGETPFRIADPLPGDGDPVDGTTPDMPYVRRGNAYGDTPTFHNTEKFVSIIEELRRSNSRNVTTVQDLKYVEKLSGVITDPEVGIIIDETGRDRGMIFVNGMFKLDYPLANSPREVADALRDEYQANWYRFIYGNDSTR